MSIIKLRKLFFPCVVGILLNLSAIFVAKFLELPVFFESLGTIFISASGGYLPGVTVAFFTNIICGIFQRVSLDYSTINVIIALFAAFFARKKLFDRIYSIIVLILFFSVLSATLGLGLTILFSSQGSERELSSPLMLWISNLTGLERYTSYFISIFLSDILDKTIAVTFTAMALKRMPEKVKKFFDFNNWNNSETNLEFLKNSKTSRVRKISLRLKVSLFVGGIMILVMGGATFTAYSLYREESIKSHIALGHAVATMAANSVNARFVNEYLRTGVKTVSYLRTKSELEVLAKSAPEIKYIYVYKILEDGCHVVFDMSTEDDPGSELGEVISFDPSFEKDIPDLLAGKPIEPTISNDKYGWLLTVYVPVYDDDGVCQCYAAVDVSMAMLSEQSISFWAKIISIFMGFFILLSIVAYSIAESNFTFPINAIAAETGAFAYDTEEARTRTLKLLRNLDIRTGDEIENLYVALLKTISDTVQYIRDVQHKNSVIEKMQNGLILVMAELVESRDKNTGDHVRKTSAYVKIITEQMKKEGIYKEELTDEFIEAVINSAPLHDIGKIHIPDAILNKPGKLTDDEFNLMKTHTTVGRHIIDNVIKIVPDPGYLSEARNLAAYHHERWDGRGYPEGLSGDKIPLSARIMSVADVFDALVSKRSYKEGFPFEKAISIIREGIGANFDPQIVKAFFDAEKQVREVSEEYSKSIL